MAQILQPLLAFTEIFNTTQERATASFKVRFTQTELSTPKTTYTAQVRLEGIRVIPLPTTDGSPTWLQSSVTLQTTTLKVKKPTGVLADRSLSTDFEYGLVRADPWVWDSLHVVIELFRTFYLAGVLVTAPVCSNTTNYLRLTFGNLANPQPNGVIIPPPS